MIVCPLSPVSIEEHLSNILEIQMLSVFLHLFTFYQIFATISHSTPEHFTNHDELPRSQAEMYTMRFNRQR